MLRPLCDGKERDALVFRPERGAPAICGSALYRRFVAAAARAGLRRIRFHDLRHSFGTRMIQKHDVSKVQRWMGHKDISTTQKYLHYKVDPDDAQAMDDAWEIEPAVAPEPAPEAPLGTPVQASEGGVVLPFRRRSA